jgi:hypothetical protein
MCRQRSRSPAICRAIATLFVSTRDAGGERCSATALEDAQRSTAQPLARSSCACQRGQAVIANAVALSWLGVTYVSVLDLLWKRISILPPAG